MQTLLPIEDIGNWLNRTIANGQMHNERFLNLKILDDVPNLSEMFEYLKKVCHFFVNYCNCEKRNFICDSESLDFCLGPYI